MTAIGGSATLDDAPDLEPDVPSVVVGATVGEPWVTGMAVAEQLRAEVGLGAEVIIGLRTHGPIAMANFDAMRPALAGAARIVLVTVHVDRPWHSEVSAVLATGVRATPNARLADRYRLSAPTPAGPSPTRPTFPSAGSARRPEPRSWPERWKPRARRRRRCRCRWSVARLAEPEERVGRSHSYPNLDDIRQRLTAVPSGAI